MFGIGLIGLLILVVAGVGIGLWVQRSRPAEAPAGASVVPHRRADVQPSGRHIPLLTEAVGYIGGILVLSGLIAAIGQNWKDFPRGAQLAILVAAALGCLALGWLTRDSVEPAFRRLAAVTWMLSVAGFAGAVAVVNVIADTSGETIFLTVATSTTAYAALLWWLNRTAVQQVVLYAGVLISAASIIDFTVVNAASGVYGITLWAIGVAWLALGWRRTLEPWFVAVPLGLVTALIAPSAIGTQWALFTLGIGTAAVVMTLAVLLRFAPGLWLGAIAMLCYVIAAVVYYFGDSLGVPTALAITGALVLAGAVGVARVLPMMKRRPPMEQSPRAEGPVEPPEQHAA